MGSRRYGSGSGLALEGGIDVGIEGLVVGDAFGEVMTPSDLDERRRATPVPGHRPLDVRVRRLGRRAGRLTLLKVILRER